MSNDPTGSSLGHSSRESLFILPGSATRKAPVADRRAKLPHHVLAILAKERLHALAVHRADVLVEGYAAGCSSISTARAASEHLLKSLRDRRGKNHLLSV